MVLDETHVLWSWDWDTIPSQGRGQTSPHVILAGTQVATLTLFQGLLPLSRFKREWAFLWDAPFLYPSKNFSYGFFKFRFLYDKYKKDGKNVSLHKFLSITSI